MTDLTRVHPIRPDGPDTRRATAPGELALVQAYINALDREAGIEEWPTAAHLERWLADHGLSEADPGTRPHLLDDDLIRAVGLREALRDLVAVGMGEDAGDDAITRLRAAVGDAGRALVAQVTSEGRIEMVPSGSGMDQVAGRMLAIIARAQIEGTWSRMRLCRNPECRWAFYDASKNRSSVWCDMAMCGSRHKASAYRERRKMVER